MARWIVLLICTVRENRRRQVEIMLRETLGVCKAQRAMAQGKGEVGIVLSHFGSGAAALLDADEKWYTDKCTTHMWTLCQVVVVAVVQRRWHTCWFTWVCTTSRVTWPADWKSVLHCRHTQFLSLPLCFSLSLSLTSEDRQQPTDYQRATDSASTALWQWHLS